MTESDFDKFSDALTLTSEIYGNPLSPHVIHPWFEALKSYQLKQITQALSRHIRNPKSGQFPPRPADIVREINGEGGGDGILGAEEAWGKLSLYGDEERATFSWTGEMREAWGAASPLFHAGDRIAARMAFIEAYKRAVSATRARGGLVCWEMSFGWDRAGRAPAVVEAFNLGRISKRAAYELLTNRLGEDPGEAKAQLGEMSPHLPHLAEQGGERIGPVAGAVALAAALKQLRGPSREVAR